LRDLNLNGYLKKISVSFYNSAWACKPVCGFYLPGHAQHIRPLLCHFRASAAAVGIVSGFGELIGYALRFVSGYIGDKTRQYWTITFIGYAVNLLAVPLLAFANRWELAAMLIIMERIGKAIRAPVRDVLISNAAKQIGPGWGFGLHKAMDQIGGLTGPLVVALVLFVKGGYKTDF
jgi:hypothetical protein